MKYVRAERLGRIRWGVLDGEVIHTLKYPPYAGKLSTMMARPGSERIAACSPHVNPEKSSV